LAAGPELRQAGLAAHTLITTTEQSWTYPWQGGWLPPEALEAPARTAGRLPLTLLLEGSFPAVEVTEDTSGHAVLTRRDLGAAQRPGWLCLVGSSEMFKNHRLHTPGFEHPQFLLNLVAAAVHGEDLAALQARHRTTAGFAYQTPQTKGRWRAFVVGAGPLAVLLLGVARRWRRRRSAT
jgi:hypothetical protein